MKRITFLMGAAALVVQTSWATDFTLKASVSGVDFDWSLGSNYEGEPAVGPVANDKIIIPAGVTAIVNAAAASKTGTCGICDIEVQSGGTLQILDDGTSTRNYTYVRTLTGEGTVTTPRTGAGAANDLRILSSCRFDGVFAGVVNFRVHNGVRFELTRADHPSTGAPIHQDTSTYAIRRFLPASGSGYAPGYKSFNLSTASTFEYVGEPGLSETAEPQLWSTRKFIIDSGAYGGLTLHTYVGDGNHQRSIILTGSNVVDSALRVELEGKSATRGPVCVVKEGSGTWKLEAARSTAVPMTGSIAVRDGTLKYENFAAVGTLCAFGLSTSLNTPAYLDPIKSTDAIPYAILFDGPAEKVGFLESTYEGNAVVTNYDRLIGLETSGGIRSAKGRLALAVTPTAAAGEKLLVLDGAADHNDTLSGVSDGANGTVSVEKRGAGAWTLRPPFGFSGKLAVKAGRLELFNGGDRFNWYRMSIKENAFVSETYGVIATNWFITKVGNLSNAAMRTQQLAKWILLDENGVVRNDFTSGMVLSGNEFSAQPTNAFSICCGPMEMSTPDGRSMSGTRPITALCATLANWYNQATPKLLDVNDESTWATIVVRLADDVPEIKYCDFLASLGFPSDYCGRVPTAFRVDASCDGLEWTTVFDRNDFQPPTYAGNWYSGVNTGSRATLTFTDASSRLPLSPSKPVAQPAIALDATVSVAAGATLCCRGAFTISKIELFADGMGAIEGGAVIAATGTLIVPELAPNERTKTFATSLKDLSGAANLANWQTSCDGLTSRYMPRYDPATGNVLVMRRGLAVIIR